VISNVAGIFRRESALSGAGRQPARYSLAELFHENTKLRRLASVAPSDGSGYGTRELEAMARAYKRYRSHPQVPLPGIPRDPAAVSLAEAIAARRTCRDFASSEIELAELSALLHWTYGITGEMRLPGGGVQHLRAAPSAGALYPGEIYLGVRGIKGLEPGLYHYEVSETSLARLSSGDPSEQLVSVCCGQEYPRHAAAVVLISAVLQRTTRKYGDRGYRYVLLDIGHLAQNLCLVCTALGLSVVTTCGFYDEEAADLLGIDGRDESVMYVAFVGRRDKW
jgi:SagB-type dehydrogenase family enzyme